MWWFKMTFAFLAAGGGTTYALVAAKEMSRPVAFLVAIVTFLGMIIMVPEAWDAVETTYVRTRALIGTGVNQELLEMKASLERKIEEARSDAARVKKELSEAKKSFEAERKVSAEKLATAEKSLEEKLNKIRSLEEQIASKEKKITELQSEVDHTNKRIEQLSERLKTEINARRSAELKLLLVQPWKTVCTKARNADEAKAELNAAQMGYNNVAIGLVKEWSQNQTCYKVTQPIPGELLRPDIGASNNVWSHLGIFESFGLQYSQILERGQKYGLMACPWEVAPALRISFTDQSEGDSLILIAEPRHREGAKDEYFRIPELGNKKPKRGVWKGVPFDRQYLSVLLTDERQLLPVDHTYVLCMR